MNALCLAAFLTVWTANPMVRVTPGSMPPKDAEREISLSLARRERESAQILVTCDAETELRGVSLEIEPLEREDGAPFSGDVKWERVGYVPRVPGCKPHPDAPGEDEKWLPDPLLPARPFDVARGTTQGAWLTVYASPDAKAGLYRSSVRVTQNGKTLATVPLAVRVRNFSLGRTFRLDTAFSLMDGFLRKKYPGSWQTMKKQAIDVMLDHRLNPDDISRTSPPDLEDLEHARRRGMSRFNILNIVPQPASNVSWLCSAPAETLFSDGFYRKFSERLRPYLDKLAGRGLDRHAYIYGFDECKTNYYSGIDAMWRRLKADFPELPVMTTSTLFWDYAKGRTNKFDCVTTDWYCPVVDQYDAKAAARLRGLGKKVWWYVCCSPFHPYANFSSIEYPPVEGRLLLGYLTWLCKADGFLYWHVNNWRWWEKMHPAMDEAECFFPEWNMKNRSKMPGDGILLYPGKEHILPSIRLANIRDGEEDYEYLVLAEERIGCEKTAAMVRQYVRSPTQFTRDAVSLAALREQLADAITSIRAQVTAKVRLGASFRAAVPEPGVTATLTSPAVLSVDLPPPSPPDSYVCFHNYKLIML